MRGRVVVFLPPLGHFRVAAARRSRCLALLALAACGSSDSSTPVDRHRRLALPGGGRRQHGAPLAPRPRHARAGARRPSEVVGRAGARLQRGRQLGLHHGGRPAVRADRHLHGTSIVEVTDPARPRNVALVPGPDEPVARDPDLRRIRLRDDGGGLGPRHHQHARPRPAAEDPDLEPDLPHRPQPLDRHRPRAAVRQRRQRARGRHARSSTSAPNPEDPPEVGAFTDFYIHDSYTRGNVLFASAINDGFEALLDVSDPRRIREITRFFTGGRFTHNSWVTRDGRYLFTTDERTGQPVEGWDITNPTGPAQGHPVHRQPGRHRPQRADRRRPAARLALHRGRVPPRRPQPGAAARHRLLRHLSRARRAASTAPGGPTSSRPRT